MPAIGDTLVGRYRLDALLGSGGMATVYRGRDLRLERDVAIKVLHADQARDATLAERFDREARAMAAVRHPAIVAIYDVEPADPPGRPEPFFVMELCEGGSLADLIAGAGFVPPDHLIPVVVVVAGGLGELHGHGMVHRDVKPHNILLAADGARLGDLGVAQSDEAGADALTSAGATVGTLAYLAPELISGGAATAASDVFGLAVSTYQALTGRLPRPATSLADLVESRTAPVALPSSVAPVLGDAFDAPLQAAMSPDPMARPSALELATGLTMALGRWARDGSRPPAAAIWAPVPDPDATAVVPTPPAPAGDAPTVVAIPPAPAGDAPTVVAIPTPPMPAPDGITEAGAVRRPRSGSAVAAALALAVVAILLIVLVLALLAGGPGGRSSPGAGGSPVQVSPSPSAGTPAAPPSVSPIPSVASTADPLAGAHAAIRDARNAIANAKGGRDGLNGKEAKGLDDAVTAVERALDEGKQADAVRRANDLVQRVNDLVRRRAVTGQQADQLSAAANALRDAIGGQ